MCHRKNLCAIESRLGHIIERKEIDGFTVRKTVPVSILNFVPKHKRDGQIANKNAGKNRHENKRDTPKKDHKKSDEKDVYKTIWGKI